MIETFQKILESPAGSFSFVFGLLVLAGWIIFYVTKFTTRISVEHGEFNKRMEKTESNINDIRMDIAEMKGSLRFVIDLVGKNDPLARKKSPLSLTEDGEKMVEKHGLDIIVDSNWDKINAVLKNLPTNNPYDIQQFCFEKAFADTTFIKSLVFFSEKDIDKLKIISFKTGLSLFSITRLMGIVIRDRYFAENKINIEEVDVYDPWVTSRSTQESI